MEEIKLEQVAQLNCKGFTETTGRVYSPDGLCPTIQTLQGGNREPKILQRPHGFNKGSELEVCPSITTSSWESNNLLQETNGLYLNDSDEFHKGELKDLSRCLKANKHDAGVSIKQVAGSLQKNAYKGNGEISPSLTSAMGMGGGQTPVMEFTNSRIRKLTPLECWRLMGFDDEDFDKAKAAGVSNSQLYKQAGNSIVVSVLEAIFSQFYPNENPKKENI